MALMLQRENFDSTKRLATFAPLLRSEVGDTLVLTVDGSTSTSGTSGCSGNDSDGNHQSRHKKNDDTNQKEIFLGGRVSSLRVAHAGFCFAGYEEGIKCYFCGVEYNVWENGESPVGVHRILNPFCEYLKPDDGVTENTIPKTTQYTSDAFKPNHNCSVNHPPMDSIIGSRDETSPKPVSTGAATGLEVNNVCRNLFGPNPDVRCQTGSTDLQSNVTTITDQIYASIRRRQNGEVAVPELYAHADRYTGHITHPVVDDNDENGTMKLMMCRESFRLLTFAEFVVNSEIENVEKAEQWAEDGFRYVGNNQVRCVYCGGVALFHDYPVQEVHKRLSSSGRDSCPMVTGIDVGDVSRELEKKVWKKIGKINNGSLLSGYSNPYPAYHPQYRSNEDRLKTFEFWPEALPLKKTALVESGFIYTGASDKCICFCCGVSLRAWKKGANPWQQHALLSPSCHFVIFKKGLDFIERNKNIQKLVTQDKTVKDPVHQTGDLVIPDQYPPTMTRELLDAYLSCGRLPNPVVLKGAVLADGELKKKEDLLDFKDNVIDKTRLQVGKIEQVLMSKDQCYQSSVATIFREQRRQTEQWNQMIQHKDELLLEKDELIDQKDEEHDRKDNRIQSLCNQLRASERSTTEAREINQLILRQQAEIEQEITRYQTKVTRYETEINVLMTEYSRLRSESRTRPLADTSDKVCMFCCTEERIMMFLPCRHILCCLGCGELIQDTRCPACRVEIETCEVVFLS